jgi:hypothetical protein
VSSRDVASRLCTRVPPSERRTKDFERLSFLYLITGNTAKLGKMLKIAEMRGDSLSRFHNALYLGSARERVAVLAASGQAALAYVLAKTHGLEDEAAALAAVLGEALVPPLPCATPALLYPPHAILRESNWPQLTVSKDFWENVAASSADKGGGASAAASAAGGLGFGDDGLNADNGEYAAAGGDGGWGGDDLDLDLGDSGGSGLGGGLGGGGGGADGGGGDEGGGWGGEDDLDLPDLPAPSATAGAGAGGSAYFVAPQSAPSAAERWARESPLAADHFAAGSFETGMAMLQRQLGLINFLPLKASALALAGASHAAALGPVATPAWRVALTRDGAAARGGGALPANCVTLPLLVERLRAGYLAMTNGRFAEAQAAFLSALQAIALVTVDSRKGAARARRSAAGRPRAPLSPAGGCLALWLGSAVVADLTCPCLLPCVRVRSCICACARLPACLPVCAGLGEVRELQVICREYITAIALELARKDATDPKRQVRGAAWRGLAMCGDACCMAWLVPWIVPWLRAPCAPDRSAVRPVSRCGASLTIHTRPRAGALCVPSRAAARPSPSTLALALARPCPRVG